MAYKVRLEDGSEIGPLDVEAVRTWYREGLIGPDTPVQKRGASRWVSLGQAVDLQRWGPAPGKRQKRGARPEVDAGPGETVTPRWRSAAGATVLSLVAGAAAAASWFPVRVPADLDGAPWLRVALGLLVPVLLLIPGWELGRRAARLLLVLASFGLLAAAGALFAQRAAVETWLVLGSAWLIASGLAAFLAPGRASALGSAGWLLVVAAGLFGLGRFGYAPESSLDRLAREWAAADTGWVSGSSGWRLEAPPGWVKLREGNPLAPAADATASFAAPRLGAVAVLWEEIAVGAGSLDQDLDALVTRRREAVPGLSLVDRAELRLAAVAARRGTGGWERDAVTYRERDSVWRDGWMRYSLAAWAPEGGAAQRALEGLAPHPGPEGSLDQRVASAAAALAQRQPLLAEAAARRVLLTERTLGLAADEALLRVLDAAARGRRALPAVEAARLAELEQQLERALPRRARPGLTALLSGEGTLQSLPALAQAVAGLDAEARLRLRDHWSRAASLAQD